MCGVVGIFGRGNVNRKAIRRTQRLTASMAKMPGIVTSANGKFHLRKIMVWYVMSLECVRYNI